VYKTALENNMGLKKLFNTKSLTQAGIIAALYVALTLASYPFSYGQVQFRLSEALTVLPAYTMTAIPGIYVGCIVANILGGSMVDAVVGSLASLIAAILSRYMPKKWLVPLPPVLANAVIIGFELNYLYDLNLYACMASVGFGELVICYGLGYPLMKVLDKYKNKIFK